MRFRAAKSGSQRAGSGFSGMKTCFHAGRYDPDRLFKSGFLEYVFCVDKEIWALCGVEEKFLVDDSGKVWEHEDIDYTCQKLLGMIPEISLSKKPATFESKIESMLTEDALRKKKINDQLNSIGKKEFTIGPLGQENTEKVEGCLEQIQKQAQQKAREILDELLEEFAGPLRIGDHRVAEIYETAEEAAEYAYDVTKSNMDTVELFLQYGTIPLLAYVGHPDAAQLAKVGGIAAIPAYTELGVSMTGMLMDGGPTVLGAASALAGQGDSLPVDQSPSLVSLFHLLVEEPDYSKVIEAQWKNGWSSSNEWNYLINGSTGFVRNKFLELLDQEINSVSDTTYIFSDSYWENALYNALIKKYLENVKLLNENYKEAREILLNFLK